MAEPTRRWRFQMHLSTAIVMMFVAGGLIWANVYGGRVCFQKGGVFVPREARERIFLEAHGWPCIFIYRWVDPADDAGRQWMFGPLDAGIDAVIAILVLLTIWFLCEWMIRRRAARKGS